MDVLLIGNDQTIEVTGVQNSVSGDYLNAATVTARIKTMAGVDVAGETWPVTLDYVSDSDGHYRGNFDDSIVLTPFAIYLVEVSVDAGVDMIAFWRKEIVAQYRTF